jgi:hypothetical protein
MRDILARCALRMIGVAVAGAVFVVIGSSDLASQAPPVPPHEPPPDPAPEHIPMSLTARLLPGTYYFRVRAKSTCGISGPSADVRAVVQ